MYTGLADPVISPLDTFAYYESVAKAMGGMDSTRSFYRFFPAPGMGHCGGGAGPNTFDALAALEQWVEKGRRPIRFPRRTQPTGGRSHASAVRVSAVAAIQRCRQYRRCGELQLRRPLIVAKSSNR